MNPEGALTLARRGELYPGVILHGGTAEERREVAIRIGRTLLCEPPDSADGGERPCGECRHCRRIAWPPEAGARADAEGGGFHPDFQVLERDLKTSTSVDATKRFLKTAQVSPFEAGGQVFVVASAESLSGEAANALLKTLEEPHTSAPRHFLLLTPSRLDLLPTLRSRCLAVFLGGAGRPDAEAVSELADELARCFRSFRESGSSAWLLAASAAIEAAADWSETRSGEPWALAAAAVVAARERPGVPPELSPRLLALAEALLGAPAWRLRAVPAGRILDGLLACHLVPGRAAGRAAPGPGVR